MFKLLLPSISHHLRVPPRLALMCCRFVVAAWILTVPCAASQANENNNPHRISWLGPLGFHLAQQGSWIQRRAEEVARFKFDPILIDSAAFEKSLPMKFVAGDVPDVFWEPGPVAVRSKVKHGFSRSLPLEVLVSIAPHYADYVLSNAPEVWMYSRYDHANWGVPTVVPFGKFPYFLIWREDWLRNVGISKTPETLAEMEQAFDLFTHGDPDQNGRNDTYGLSTSVAHPSLFFAEFFAQRDVLPFDFQKVGTRVLWGGIRPEAKEVLAMLRDWYLRGWIDPDFILSSSMRPERPFERGKVGYFSYGVYGDISEVNDPASLLGRVREYSPPAQLCYGLPPLGADGKRRMRVWGAGGHVMMFSAQTNPDAVNAVLRFLDRVYSDSNVHLELTMGKRGVHWDYLPGGGSAVLPPFEEDGDAEMVGSRNYASAAFFAPSGLPINVVETLMSPLQVSLVSEFANSKWGICNALGKSEVLPSASLYLPDLIRKQEKVYSDIVRGTKPLVAFDEFVDDFKAHGGQALLNEVSEFMVSREAVIAEVQQLLHESKK